ncbi:MAG: Co2+/Mg2+ efflux protein ApaG [Cryomorphaceae bacterium]|nr:MAG: Co2+/Mg2+ efflux protein ApaG [Cryomorphaceae bacterium]
MVTAVSSGIKITVVTQYERDYSSPANEQYFFIYNITIENTNDFPVKLLRREWFIIDSNGDKREVEGEGVVGEQPVIPPGSKYSYSSGCDFMTDFGSMSGSYLMKRLDAGLVFKAHIPRFYMLAPWRLN